MASNSFVLVTGVSGYLGAHVVDQLVKGGHRVRGTVRSAKVTDAQATLDAAYGAGKVEVVAIDDLILADFSSALKDVTAVIHVAAPVPGRADAETTLNGSIEGSLSILRKGQQLGIKNYSIVSSVVALVDLAAADPNVLLTDKHWNVITREIALDPATSFRAVYAASKVLAEQEIWKFAEEHPDINVTTVNPTMILGPNAPGQNIPLGDAKPLSTNLSLYNILLPDTKFRTIPVGFVDVRDVAAALIAGTKVTGRNRIPFTGEWFELKDAVDYVASIRPELKSRLANIVPTGQTKAMVDTSKALKALGVKPRPWKETVIETIDFLVKLEKDWRARGVDLDTKLKQNEWRA